MISKWYYIKGGNVVYFEHLNSADLVTAVSVREKHQFFKQESGNSLLTVPNFIF